MTATPEPIPVKHTYSLLELRQIPIFFVVAKSRSGTTLLQSMLHEHSCMVAPPESKFVLYLSKFGMNRKFVPGDEKKIIQLLRYDRKIISTWDIDLEALEKNTGRIIAEGAGFGEICKLIYLSHQPAAHKPPFVVISDKNPSYTLYLLQLMKVFPQARIIHLVRDYHDCVASNLVTFKKNPVGMISWSWRYTNRCVENFKCQQPARCYTLFYEDLCRQPEASLRAVCDFLEIPFEAGMFNFHRSVKEKQEQFQSAAFERIHGGLMQPIHVHNIGKYQTQLSKKQILTMEYVCSRPGLDYGYQRSLTGNPGAGTRAGLFFSLLRQRKNIFIVKAYYRLPYFMRKALFHSVNWMYKKTGKTIRYSRVEVKLMNENNI